MISNKYGKSISKRSIIIFFQLLVFFFSSAYYIKANNFDLFNKSNKSFEYLEFQKDEKVIFYIVDGEPVSAKEVDKLKLEDIEQMEYVKEKEKIKLYTDEEVDTVVLITTKNKKKEEE